MNRQEKRRQERDKNKITESLCPAYYVSPIRTKSMTRANQKELQKKFDSIGLLSMMTLISMKKKGEKTDVV